MCSNNVEMSFLSALMAYASVNTLSVTLGRFMNFWVESVLSITNKMSSLRTQHICHGKSRTSGPSGTRLLLVLSAICRKKNYSSYKKSLE